MLRNKKSQAVLVGGMLGLLAFIMVVQFIAPIKGFITDTRAVTGLDCINSSITVGTKATCVIVDWTLPGFVGAIIFTAIGIAGGAVFRRIKKKE